MEQTEDKIKHIYHWSGSDVLPLPFRRVHEEKQACVYGRVPGTPFCGYILGIGGGVVTKGKEKELPPGVKVKQDPVPGFWDGFAEFFVRLAVSCIEPVTAGHLEVLFGYVLDEQGNKVHDREFFST